MQDLFSDIQPAGADIHSAGIRKQDEKERSSTGDEDPAENPSRFDKPAVGFPPSANG